MQQNFAKLLKLIIFLNFKAIVLFSLFLINNNNNNNIY